jgi:hypothetical protein
MRLSLAVVYRRAFKFVYFIPVLRFVVLFNLEDARPRACQVIIARSKASFTLAGSFVGLPLPRSQL